MRYRTLLISLLLLFSTTHAHAELPKELRAGVAEHIAAKAIIDSANAIPVIITIPTATTSLFDKILDQANNVDDLEGDPVMYFLTHLSLVEAKIERAFLHPFKIGTSILVASETAPSILITDIPDQPGFIAPQLIADDSKWLAFITRVKSARDFGQGEKLSANTAKHYSTLKAKRLLPASRIFTLYNRKAAFKISSGNNTSETSQAIIEDMNYIFKTLRAELVGLTQNQSLSEERKEAHLNNLTSKFAKDVAEILFVEWRPGSAT